MATLYVSNTAVNGYAVGSDSYTRTQAQSKQTPWLTVTKALGAMSLGDVIVVNDGTYNEAAALAPSSPCVINGETDYGAIIRAASGTTRVIHFAVGAAGSTLGKIVLDANNVQGSCWTVDSVSNVNGLTINGTKLKNPTNTFGNGGSKLYNFTATGGWICESNGVGVQYGFSLSSPAACTNTIGTGTFNVTGFTGTFIGVFGSPAVTGCTLNTSGITYNCTGSGGAAQFKGFQVSGWQYTDHGSHVYNVTGCTALTCAGMVQNHATIACATARAHDLTGSLNTATAGYLVLIGDDAVPTTKNNITYHEIYDNNLSGANHGYCSMYVSNGKAWGNTADNVVIGDIIKGDATTVGNKHYGTVVKRLNSTSGGAFRFKGALGAGNVIAQGTHIISAGYTGTTFMATDGAALGQFVNCCAYGEVAPVQFVQVDVGSAAVFTTNNYYSTVAEASWPVNTFSYNGVSYQTATLWKASVNEPTALSVNPGFTNEAGGDYSLTAGSALTTAGTKWWSTGPRPTGNDGNPFPDFDISVGAFQSRYGSFYPTRI